MPTTTVEKGKIRAITIVGDFMSEVLRAAADYIEDSDKRIPDVVVTMTNDGEPMIVIYEEFF